MLSLLINILIAFAILGLCWYLVRWLVRRLGAGDPIPVIIDIVFVLIALVWLLGILGVGGWGGRVVVL